MRIAWLNSNVITPVICHVENAAFLRKEFCACGVDYVLREIYFQLDSHQSMKPEGRDLGLYIVISSLGGTCEINSKERNNSGNLYKFVLSFPLEEGDI
jgi:hypothetical protein